MVENLGTVDVCTSIYLAEGVTLEKEVILNVTSADDSGKSI